VLVWKIAWGDNVGDILDTISFHFFVTWQCSALAYCKSERSLGVGEKHDVTFTIQKRVNIDRMLALL